MAVMDSEMAMALCIAAAALAMKMAVSHALVARARLITRTTFGNQPFAALFTPMFLAYPSIGTPPVDLLLPMEKNNAENEPHLLLLFFFATFAGKMPTDTAIMILNYWVASRFGHNLVMLFPDKPAWGVGLQTITYVPSMLLPIFIGAMFVFEVM